jgi:hypothetical protein
MNRAATAPLTCKKKTFTNNLKNGRPHYMDKQTADIPSRLWIWLSVEGTRWRITHDADGVWSCQIGIGGKRIGPWKPGLPPTLEIWPLGDFKDYS